jgi:hypothetical protein
LLKWEKTLTDQQMSSNCNWLKKRKFRRFAEMGENTNRSANEQELQLANGNHVDFLKMCGMMKISQPAPKCSLNPSDNSLADHVDFPKTQTCGTTDI